MTQNGQKSRQLPPYYMNSKNLIWGIYYEPKLKQFKRWRDSSQMIAITKLKIL